MTGELTADELAATRVTGRVPATLWGAIAERIIDPAELTRLGRSAETRSLFREAVRLYELAGTVEATIAQARLIERAGDVAGAERVLRAGTGVRVTRWLAGLLERAGRADEALELLRPQPSWELAGLLERTGSAEEARRMREDLTWRPDDPVVEPFAEEPDDPAALMAAAEEAERPEDAEELLARAASAGDTAARNRLAALLARTRAGTDEPEGLLRYAAEAGDPAARLELAELLKATGRDGEARRLTAFGLAPGGATATPW